VQRSWTYDLDPAIKVRRPCTAGSDNVQNTDVATQKRSCRRWYRFTDPLFRAPRSPI
jgi:hypothetical protein